ncbi:glucokinase [Chamaesiphon sp. VAR_69_metabat_338]|uniref:glucokinase n=1 Tax=Chamaesiphon sp. VAR_69_metabat_338 TaxID=2964704 RepID=UPI00286E0CBE|nr:glucokinase [Chamaesiphon sp. VAR_69_metabat_338]
MTYLLAGDLGGTKTLLRLVTATDPDRSQFEKSYHSQSYPNIIAIVREFVAAAQVQLGTIEIVSACLGIAGAIVDRSSYLPNLDWHIHTDELERELQIPKLKLINDFTAIGYGIPRLHPIDLHALQSGTSIPQAPIAIIGAGTGLGQGVLIHDGRDYRVVATEGGHADFAARSRQEFELFEYICKSKQLDRVSAERVLSGAGIVSIYQYLRDTGNFSEAQDVTNVVRAWESATPNAVDPSAIISAMAIAKTDPLSAATMKMFVSIYGAEAGNLALKTLPYAGLYIAGGIAAKNLPILVDGTFIAAFNQKGRVSDLLSKIPVYIILNPQVGLLGAVAQAAALAT